MSALQDARDREIEALETLLSLLPDGKKSVDRHYDRSHERIADARSAKNITLHDAYLKDAWHEYHTARMLAYKPTKDAKVVMDLEEALHVLQGQGQEANS